MLHSEICGSKLAYSSPQLIAVNRVLLRLPMPRHSLCALLCFTICSFHGSSQNFRVQLFVVFVTQHFGFLTFMSLFLLTCSFHFAFCFHYSVFKLHFFSVLFQEQISTDDSSSTDICSCKQDNLFLHLREVCETFSLSLTRTLFFFAYLFLFSKEISKWWAQMDSNHRPHAYQACALTT